MKTGWLYATLIKSLYFSEFNWKRMLLIRVRSTHVNIYLVELSLSNFSGTIAIPISNLKWSRMMRLNVMKNYTYCSWQFPRIMMSAANGSIFRRYWPFVRGIHRSPANSLTKANDTELWCFLSSTPEQTIELTIETPVFWDAITLIMTSL